MLLQCDGKIPLFSGRTPFLYPSPVKGICCSCCRLREQERSGTICQHSQNVGMTYFCGVASLRKETLLHTLTRPRPIPPRVRGSEYRSSMRLRTTRLRGCSNTAFYPAAYHLRLDTQYRTCHRFLGLFWANRNIICLSDITGAAVQSISTHEKAPTIGIRPTTLPSCPVVLQSQSVPYSESRLSSFSTSISSPATLAPPPSLLPSRTPLSRRGLQILTTHTTREENDDRPSLASHAT